MNLAARLPNSTSLTSVRPEPSIVTELPVIPDGGAKPLNQPGRQLQALLQGRVGPAGLRQRQ